MALSRTESEGESSSLFGSPVPKFVKEREVPSGPVVTTQCFHSQGPGSIPGQDPISRVAKKISPNK